MVGGYNGEVYILPSESTTDGVFVDSSAVAAFGSAGYTSCLVNVNETTLILFGGDPSPHYRGISLHTIGSSEWEVRKFIQESFALEFCQFRCWCHSCLYFFLQTLPFELEHGRTISGCGLVTREDGTQYAMVAGGALDESSPETSEILDLQTMELHTGN